MKVVAVNGSPNQDGNTYHALKVVLDELEQSGIETELIHIGKKPIGGCTACGSCGRNLNEKCVLLNDPVNESIQKMKEADGLVLGSPVYYSSIAGNMKSFLDRAFYVASANGGMLRHKVGASVAAVRRSGGVTTFNQLNQYILHAEMVMPASNYWNVIHGMRKGECLEDKEGVQIMKVLGKNMSWVLKMIENGKANEPDKEKKVFMNFIR